MFDPTEMVDGRIEVYATHPSTWNPGNTVVGHYLIARDMGLSDNFEVSLRWQLSGGFSFVHQVSPVAFVDLDSADPLQMGVLPIWDVSINATYLQNAFRNEPISDVCNTAHYTLLGGGMGGNPVEDVNWITLRSEDGVLTYYWNGVRRGQPVPVPSWATGRTWFGVHIIAIDFPIGSEYPGGWGEVTEHFPAIADEWSVRSLVDRPPVIESATASPTSGAAPLTVAFAAAASDPDGDPLTFEWDFGDGTISSQPQVSHTYTSAGAYTARVRVRAGGRTTVSNPITIDVLEAPDATIDAPPDGLVFSAGDSIPLAGSAVDDGPLEDDDFRWDVWWVRDGERRREYTAVGRTSVFDIPTTVRDWEGAHFRIKLTVTDATGLTDTDAIRIWPRRVSVTLTSEAGAPVTVDGVSRPTPFVLDTAAGVEHSLGTATDVCHAGRRWIFDRWSDGETSPARPYEVPSSDHTLTARFTDIGPCAAECQGVPATVVIGAGERPTAGDDVIVGTPGADIIDAGPGDDLVCGGGGPDRISGGAGADRLLGEGGRDRLAGGIGDDVLDGGAGADHLMGDDGDDVLLARGGDDVANGGPGDDHLEGKSGNDELRGGIGDDVLLGFGGVDDLFGGGNRDRVDGGTGNDLVSGANGDDVVFGGPGDDVVRGSRGRDVLFGNGGDDRVAGEAGDDDLRGGSGVDHCLGGAGIDTARACEVTRGVP